MKNEVIFRELFDLAIDCMLILGSDGLIKEINSVGHEQLGYSKAEMMGKHISQFISPEFASILGERINELLEQGHLTYESAQVRKDGSVIPVEISSRKIIVDGQNAFLTMVSAEPRTNWVLAQNASRCDGMWKCSPFLTNSNNCSLDSLTVAFPDISWNTEAQE